MMFLKGKKRERHNVFGHIDANMEETMPAFALRYISGPQLKLTVSDEHTVEAASLDEALRSRSDWPIERNWPGTCAWAKNPGTSLYHVEAWEGTLLA